MSRNCYDIQGKKVDCWALDQGLLAQGIYLNCKDAEPGQCPNGGRFIDIYGNCSNYCSPISILGESVLNGCFGDVRDVVLDDVPWKKYVIYVLFLLIVIVVVALASKFWNR